jgi:hypothetical protein
MANSPKQCLKNEKRYPRDVPPRVLSALEEHQSVSELDVQMRPSIARRIKLLDDAKA